MSEPPVSPEDLPPPPLQFSLRAMLGLMVAVSLLFGTLRWMGVPPRDAAMVLLALVVSAAAAIGLLVAIARQE